MKTFELPYAWLNDGERPGDFPVLTPQYHDDVGVDIRSVEHVTLEPGETRLIRTGLAIAVPAGVECQVRPRSGLALKMQITVLNAPGTIDPQYRGEVAVIAHNAATPFTLMDVLDMIDCHGLDDMMARDYYKFRSRWLAATVNIAPGDRIAQLVFAEYLRAVPVEVAVLPESDRGAGGFGSTGGLTG